MKSPLLHSLLIFNPALENPELPHAERFSDFHQALIYIIHCGPQGTIGINLNRFFAKSVVELSELFPSYPTIAETDTLIENILCGGTEFQNMPWILHAPNSDIESEVENEYLALSWTPESFTQVLALGTPALVGAGSFGWVDGQLEKELAAGLWLHFPCDYDYLASIPFNESPLFAVHLFLKLCFGRVPERV